ncbi:Cysteine desulfuration protein SufE [compost metagenome]
MSLPLKAQDALDAFTTAGSWEQRARLLMQWGERLEALDDAERGDTNRVHGCESQVWLVGERQGDRWHFRANSDARLIRGLLAVLLARVDGLPAGELAAVDLADWFNQLGLGRQLSPSRSNGLNAVLKKMSEMAGD